MIDIHCHILPGIDDGPSNLDESIDMVRIAASDGITHIVATPHFSYEDALMIADIDRACAGLAMKIRENGHPIRLLSGADIRLTYELIGGVEAGVVPTINGSRYFLLELPDMMPPNLDRFLFAARVKGYVPIITHPERNHSLLAAPEKMEILRDAGTLFQVTAMSITGEFGPQIRSFSHMLLKNGFVDFIASDAHDTIRRAPVMSAAYREISDILDEQTTRKIFFENPESVTENREIRV